MTIPVPPDSDALAQLRQRASALDARASDWFALGRAQWQVANADSAQRGAALDALIRAYQIDPACDPTLLFLIAQYAFVLRDWPLVESATQRLLAQNPDDGNAMVWRAAAREQSDDFAEAERLLRRATQVAPGNAIVLNKLALCLKEQARFDEGEALLREALRIAPDFAHARFDLSELEIRSGRYADGWAHYEARVAFGDESNAGRRALEQICAHWTGQPLTGKTLVVYAEQGNGDCLWAIRFLPALAERARREGGRVILGYDGPLRQLFERALPFDVRNEVTLDTQPDFHCGLMSLPLRLGAFDPHGWGRAYLRPDPALAEAWRERVLAAAGQVTRRVGIVWNGNPVHIRDIRRSVPVDQFESLLTVPGITWFALSPGRSETVGRWRDRGMDIVDLTAHFSLGFDDVAALLANLDCVVTIDSGPAHLAGALGVPTLLLIDHVSAWFWGREMHRTPWYDSIELFRQPAVGEWAPVLASVRERLELLAAQR